MANNELANLTKQLEYHKTMLIQELAIREHTEVLIQTRHLLIATLNKRKDEIKD